MTSKLKSDTARANGAKSRGPKSPETREKSSRNSLSHGCTARHTILLACEDPGEFQQILDEYMTTYQPSNGGEKRMVEEMFAAHWRIRRLKTIETALLDYEMVRQEPELEKKLTHFDAGIHLALSFCALADESRSLSLISRYEARLQRIHDRTLNTLLALRAKPQPIEPKAPAPPPVPAPVPPTKNSESNPSPSAKAAETTPPAAATPRACAKSPLLLLHNRARIQQRLQWSRARQQAVFGLLPDGRGTNRSRARQQAVSGLATVFAKTRT